MTAQPSTSLSVAVVCYHSPVAQLHTLLDSLLAAIRFLRERCVLPVIEVYLIDNTEYQELALSSFTDLAQALNELNVELRLLQGHGNIGYGSAHNLVIGELTSEMHLLLNPDVTLDETSLVEGVQYLLSNDHVAIVSPNAVDGNGKKQYLCKTYPAIATFLVRGFVPAFLKPLFSRRLSRFEMHGLSEEAPTSGIPIASGCCMLCRTKKLQTIHGFDEDYFLYFEDFDLSLRMQAEGEIAYVPTMRIEHGGGHAARKGLEHLKMFARSAVLFYNTHGWRWFRQG